MTPEHSKEAEETIASVKREMSKFIQIAFGAASNGCSLYALDEDGNVWEYQYGERVRYWKMVSMEKRTEPNAE